MIYFDVTKIRRAGHPSGLNRVSARLRDELGAAITPTYWDEGFRESKGWKKIRFSPEDWLVTGELFSEEERPGIGEFLRARPCRTAAIYYDAIPLKFPHITWPRSVARHPHYLSLLASFDRVLAISKASAAELREYWHWQGRVARATVGTIELGADFSRRPRTARSTPPPPALLCLGILEPRKNQIFLLEVCEELWREGLKFDLHLVGRVNPHFENRLPFNLHLLKGMTSHQGNPLITRIKALRKAGRPVTHHEGMDDVALLRLYAATRATIFPTIAEGCGLPVIESLWQGVPCLCSDLSVLRENADGGGCWPVTVNDLAAWTAALRRMLTDDTAWLALAAEAAARPLPTWADTARQLRAELSK